MRNFERRIRKLEEELNIGEDPLAWFKSFKQSFPELCQDLGDFFRMHWNDPGFIKEATAERWSDDMINQIADYCLKRVRERPVRHRHPSSVGNQGGQGEITSEPA